MQRGSTSCHCQGLQQCQTPLETSGTWSTLPVGGVCKASCRTALPSPPFEGPITLPLTHTAQKRWSALIIRSGGGQESNGVHHVCPYSTGQLSATTACQPIDCGCWYFSCLLSVSHSLTAKLSWQVMLSGCPSARDTIRGKGVMSGLPSKGGTPHPSRSWKVSGPF